MVRETHRPTGTTPLVNRENVLSEERKPRILIANDLLSYREAIATALQALRPSVEVLMAEPGKLDLEVQRASPGMVVCDRVTTMVRKEVPVWVELYPEGEQLAVISIRRQRSTATGIELNDLVSIIDQTANLM
ncbi:MAG TPA: hypothetical protein VHM16_03430 [Rubrobacteraceae bacterium]|nr:hypothetical protein [Rubrobacteraceae bacterium]